MNWMGLGQEKKKRISDGELRRHRDPGIRAALRSLSITQTHLLQAQKATPKPDGWRWGGDGGTGMEGMQGAGICIQAP
jgi:hypothetical protein